MIPQLSVETRNLLAAWIDSRFVEVFAQTEEGDPAKKHSLIAEVGGESRRVRSGVIGPALPAPGAGWLESIELSQIVRLDTSDGLGVLSGRVDASDLREEPRGALAGIDVRTLLNGKVASFGKRFWKLVSDEAPGLHD